MSVICVGDIRADISAHLRKGKTVVETDLGGTGANVALLIAKYGLPVTMLGTVSSGPEGRFLLDRLKESGVDTSKVLITENGCFNTLLVTKDGQEVLSYPWMLPGTRYDDIGDIGFGLIHPGKGDIVHATGAFIENDAEGNGKLISFLERSKENGAEISFDINARELFFGSAEPRLDVLRRCAELADLLTGSRHEFALLWGTEDPEQCLSDCFGEKELIVVRNEADPIFVKHGSRVCVIPVLPVDVRNPMGAGDSFDAALIYAISVNADAETCVRFASWAAGYAISRETARQIPAPDDIKAFMKGSAL